MDFLRSHHPLGLKDIKAIMFSRGTSFAKSHPTVRMYPGSLPQVSRQDRASARTSSGFPDRKAPVGETLPATQTRPPKTSLAVLRGTLLSRLKQCGPISKTSSRILEVLPQICTIVYFFFVLILWTRSFRAGTANFRKVGGEIRSPDATGSDKLTPGMFSWAKSGSI